MLDLRIKTVLLCSCEGEYSRMTTAHSVQLSFFMPKFYFLHGAISKREVSSMAKAARMSERDKRIVEDYSFRDTTLRELGEREGITAQAVHRLVHSEKAAKYIAELGSRKVSRARAYLVGQSVKAARSMATALDVDDPYAKIQAARDILDRTGVKDAGVTHEIVIEMPVTFVVGMPGEITGMSDEDKT